MTLEEKLEVKEGCTDYNTLIAIRDYIIANASEALTEKIINGNKTVADCWKFIYNQARSFLSGKSGYVDEKTVFGWAMHFFEEDDIKVDEKIKKKGVKAEKVEDDSDNLDETPKAKPKKAAKKKEEPKVEEDAPLGGLFDFL